MKNNLKMYGVLAICAASALLFSCSGLSSSRAVVDSAAGSKANEWIKADFTITENAAVTTRTVSNTGSSQLQLSYKALVGSTLQVSVTIYRLLDGKSVPFISGTSDPLVVAAGTNTVVIKTVNRMVELQIMAARDLPGNDDVLPEDDFFPWKKAELWANGSVDQTVFNTSLGDDENEPRPVEFTYWAMADISLEVTAKVYEQVYEYDELLATLSGSLALTPKAGMRRVVVPVDEKDFPLFI